MRAIIRPITTRDPPAMAQVVQRDFALRFSFEDGGLAKRRFAMQVPFSLAGLS
jgi:hypothetical protein